MQEENYLSVVRVPQSITMSAIPNLSVGDFLTSWRQNASSGLLVTFYSSNPALATIVGEYVYIRGAGDVTITAMQEGDRRYEEAANVDRNFTISWGNLFSDSTPGLRLWFDATDVNGDGEPDNENDFISDDKVVFGLTNPAIQITLYREM